MTVLPFRDQPQTTATATKATARPVTSAEVTGTFPSPSGGRGSFTGRYRLERLVDQFGQLAAAGVFTGELRHADGTHLSVCSRRLTCAAFLGTDPGVHEIRIGPVDVNLLGFMVTVDEFSTES